MMMMREMVVAMVMVTGLRPGNNSNRQHSSTAVVRMVTGLRAR